MEHFADRLRTAVTGKGTSLCVGLDPVADRLPGDVGPGARPVERVERFCEAVIERVAPIAACAKVQAACFERYGAAGVAAMERVVERVRAAGLIAILDAKRGDIGVSAEHYAAAHLAARGGEAGPDALTVQSHFGADGLEPFCRAASAEGRGVFALLRTSNPGSAAWQRLALRDGRRVVDALAEIVREAGDAPGRLGRCGESLLGAVVGATDAADAARLRAALPRQVFLVPGFGAQGGGAEALRACFRPDGTGAVVNAGRSILYAFEDDGARPWLDAVEAAARRHAEALRAVAAPGA